MATTNIGETIDPFYRYKRPVSTVEIRQGKTIISNLDLIAKALKTKPSYILYYIQLEKSTSITNKCEIKIELNKIEIEELIDKYIEEYVLCGMCNYPELDIKKSNKKLYFVCRACGNSIEIDKTKFGKIFYKEFK